MKHNVIAPNLSRIGKGFDPITFEQHFKAHHPAVPLRMGHKGDGWISEWARVFNAEEARKKHSQTSQ